MKEYEIHVSVNYITDGGTEERRNVYGCRFYYGITSHENGR